MLLNKCLHLAAAAKNASVKTLAIQLYYKPVNKKKLLKI